MKKQTMYLDITKKVGDQSAVKTSDQLIKELEAKLAECLKVDSSIAAIAKMVNPRIEELEAQLQVAVDRIEILEFHLNEIAESDLVASNLKSMARNAIKIKAK